MSRRGQTRDLALLLLRLEELQKADHLLHYGIWIDGPKGCSEMKEVAIDVLILYFIFLLAMEASRVIGQLQRTYRTLG